MAGRNLVWLVLVLGVCAWLGDQSGRGRFNPNGPLLRVDGISVHQPCPEARQHDLSEGYFEEGSTRIYPYFDPRQGEYRVGWLSGTELEQAGQVLVRLGDSRAQVEESLGPPFDVCPRTFPLKLMEEYFESRPGRFFYLQADCCIQFQDGRVTEVLYIPGMYWALDKENPRPPQARLESGSAGR